MHSNAFPDRSLVIIDVEEKKKKKKILEIIFYKYNIIVVRSLLLFVYSFIVCLENEKGIAVVRKKGAHRRVSLRWTDSSIGYPNQQRYPFSSWFPFCASFAYGRIALNKKQIFQKLQYRFAPE